MKPDASQLDALTELMNIGVGRAAAMLNQMIDSPIELNVPVVKILQASELATEIEQPADQLLSFVRLVFRGAIGGTAALLFPTESAANLVAALTGDESSPDLDSVRAGTLSEVGNIVINGVMGSIGNVLSIPLAYELPTYVEASLAEMFTQDGDDGDDPVNDPMVLVAHTRFTVQDLEIQGTILLIFEVLSFDALLAAIDALAGAE